MSKTGRNQQLLNWLNSEKTKDEKDLLYSKNKFISEIKKINKDQIVSKPKKLSLWQKIKIILWGT
jgi:hypothetical protein